MRPLPIGPPADLDPDPDPDPNPEFDVDPIPLSVLGIPDTETENSVEAIVRGPAEDPDGTVVAVPAELLPCALFPGVCV